MRGEDLQAAQMKAVQTMFGSAASADSVTGFEVTAEVELAVEFDLARAALAAAEATTDSGKGSSMTVDLATALDALAKTKEKGGFFSEAEYREAVQKILRMATKK